MDVNSINTYLVPVAFGALGWFLQSFLKFQREFYEHRASLGHKGLIDMVTDEMTDLRGLIADLQTTTKVNQSKIENIHEQLRDIAKASKYRFEVADNRLALVEEVMRKEGYTIFKKEKQLNQVNKDTLDLEDSNEY